MPYVVRVGVVLANGAVYETGTELPDGIGDEAMVEAGAIEWREPEPTVPDTNPEHLEQPEQREPEQAKKPAKR